MTNHRTTITRNADDTFTIGIFSGKYQLVFDRAEAEQFANDILRALVTDPHLRTALTLPSGDTYISEQWKGTS
jgi:hypothetical protein